MNHLEKLEERPIEQWLVRLDDRVQEIVELAIEIQHYKDVLRLCAIDTRLGSSVSAEYAAAIRSTIEENSRRILELAKESGVTS
jgi:chromosome condensin MukBEF ATPase and DNA-binding subunit MukB